MTKPAEAMGLRERVIGIIAGGFADDLPSSDIADAAIAEVMAWLEEPTEEMLKEGKAVLIDDESQLPYAWKAMLRAAKEYMK